MYSKFGFLTYQISHVICQRFNKEAEDLGLTHSLWRALVHISENKDCRQIDLALILEVKPITLARQVDLLEQAGLVRRKKDRDDRRAYRLEITPKAQSVMEELWHTADLVEDRVLAVLSSEEKHLLINLLQHIKNNITEKNIR